MIKEYFTRLKYAFTGRFLAFLLCSQLFVKGTVFLIANSTMLPIFKRMNVDAVHVQLYMTLAMSPWTIKPLVGVISDSLTIRGYHKRFYLIQCIIVGTISGIALTSIPHELSLTFLLVVCFFGLHYETSIIDLLSEGTYARLMREHPETGTDIITLVNGFQTAGQLLGLAFVGPLSDEQLFLPIFIICVVFCALPLLPTVLGWLPEEKKSNNCIQIDWDFILNNRLALSVVALTGLSGPIMAIITIYVSHIIGIVCAFVMVALAIAGAYSAFPTLIGHVALYQMIVQIGNPSLGSAMDYWYTGDTSCVPNGPAFSFKYYITYTGIIGAIMSILAVLFYQRYMSKWKFRTVLVFTSLLVGLGGVMDLLMILRVNITMGIPDKWFYILGDSIIENSVLMLFWIPSSAIISKVCPKNMEATTYAFLAGISNFGGMISNMLGAIIFKSAGITTTKGMCNFDSLWWLVLVFHTLTPVISGILAARFLIPNKRQDEDLLAEMREAEVVEMMHDFELMDDSEF